MSPVLEQLDRVRERARGQRDLVAVALQQLDKRPEHEDVSSVREIEPDAHAMSALAGRRPPNEDRELVRIDFRLAPVAGSARRRDDRQVRAVVTGGAGFIGSHVVDALVARGDEVVVVDDLSTGREEQRRRDAIGRGTTLVVGDIRDAEFVDRLLRRERPEVVFHLAAQIDVRVSVSKPALGRGA